MITITAVIRAKPRQAENLQAALLDVATYVAGNEPDTIGFFVSRDLADPMVFTTYERFSDEAAKDAHNGSDAVAAFFAKAAELIQGDVILHTCAEVSSKN